MKIFWTYIVNTKDEKKIKTILEEILHNHGEVYELDKKNYWKDTSKYYVTFYSLHDTLDLNQFMSGILHEISPQWNFTLSNHINEINAFSEKPRNFKVSWVSFMTEG